MRFRPQSIPVSDLKQITFLDNIELSFIKCASLANGTKGMSSIFNEGCIFFLIKYLRDVGN